MMVMSEVNIYKFHGITISKPTKLITLFLSAIHILQNSLTNRD